MPAGELFDQIQRRKRLLIPDARQYAAEIVCILVYLKEQQVADSLSHDVCLF